MTGTSDKKPRILNLSGDFPDDFDNSKTPVIRRLVEITSDRFEHTVISLNRVSPKPRDWVDGIRRGRLVPDLKVQTDHAGFGHAVRFTAPPKGLFHVRFLRDLGDRLANGIGSADGPFDLVVGHKLTIEGIAAMGIARRLAVPYAVTIQGNTDSKLLAARPDLKPLLREVFHGAASVVAFAPWSLGVVEMALGKRTGPTYIIPCPLADDRMSAPASGEPELVSVFHLRNWRVKNLPGLAAAARILEKRGMTSGIKIVGGGSRSDVEAATRALGTTRSIELEGGRDQAAMHHRMNQAAGLVVPSLRESFGLVFVEALYAGIPIIYPAGRAVDGWLPDCPFAIAVNPRDPVAIADAIRKVIDSNSELKAALAEWQRSPSAAVFSRPAIAERYRTALGAAIASITTSQAPGMPAHAPRPSVVTSHTMSDPPA